MTGVPERLRGGSRMAGSPANGPDAEAAQDRASRRIASLLEAGHVELAHLRAQLSALSPQATLDRGYAVAGLSDGTLIRSAEQAVGEVRVRVAQGEFSATVGSSS